LSKVLGEWIEMSDVDLRDRNSLGPCTVDCTLDRAVRASPANNKEVAFRIPFNGLRRDLVCDPLSLGGTHLDHEIVVVWVVADVTGDMLLFQAADPRFEPRRSRKRQWPRQRCVIARVALAGVRVLCECHRH